MDQPQEVPNWSHAPERTLFQVIQQFYTEGTFTDLELFAGDHNSYSQCIRCHKLVLSSLSELFRSILTNDSDHVQFPDMEHKDLKTFIDGVYQKLDDQTLDWDDCGTELLEFFGVPLKPDSRATQVEAPNPENPPSAKRSRPQVVKSKLDIFKVDPDSLPPLPKRSKQLFAPDANKPPMPDTEELDLADEDLVNFNDDSIDPNFDYEAVLKEEEERDLEPVDDMSDDLEVDSDDGEEDLTPRPRSSRKEPPIQNDQRSQILHKNMQSVSKKDKRALYSLDAIKNQVIQGHGTLDISHTIPTLTATHSYNQIRELTRRKGGLHVLIGIKDLGEGEFVGKPLAWTKPTSQHEMGSQFDECVRAFGTTFGLSEADLISGQHLLNGQDGKTPMSYISDIQKRLFNKSTRFDLENELKDPELMEAHAKPTRSHQELTIPLNNWSLTLQRNLSVFHDVVLVGVFRHAIDCRQIHLVPDNPDMFGSILTRILYLVWSGGMQGSKIPRNDHIIDKYLRMKRITYRKKTADKLLASEGDLPRKLPSFTCDICGETLQENAHGTKRSMHKRKHIIQNMDCNCQLDKSGYDDKKRHYILFHSGWNVEPCTLCKWVGSRDALERHRATMHSEVMCDECGKLCPNAEKLGNHRRSMHKMYQCKECLEDFVGLSKLKYHLGRVHSGDKELWALYQEKSKAHSQGGARTTARKRSLKPRVPESGVFPCEKCGKIFKFDQSLKSHLKRNHGSEEDMPFRCKECGKRFFDKPKLKYHLMNVHIRSRPFVCRYENCQSDFNNQSNLRQHEVKVHGALMGKVSSINNYVSDEMMFTLAEVVHDKYNHRNEWL